jgi:hypothetical protein
MFRPANIGTNARVSAALLLLALGSLTPAARAHAGHRSYCSVRSVPGGLDVTLQVPEKQLAESRDVEGHVRAFTPGGECRPSTTGPVFEGQAERRAVFQLAFDCPAGPITLGVDYGMDVDPLAEVVCAVDGSAHVFRQGALDRVVGTPPSLAGVLWSFLVLGVEHVLSGLDHVLFVLSLLLGAAAAAVSDARGTLRRVVGLVTGFTVGHSVTLIVAALGILALPSRLTESLIALSIVVVAIHNLLERSPCGRTLTSALFGLIHGFGFASALAETGLPRRGTVPALLSFNVGIELAQLTIVLGCFPLLAWSARKPWFRRRLLAPACLLIATLAGVWFIKRALGLTVLPWLGS